MQNRIHFRLLAMLFVYLILTFIGGSFGRLVLTPVTLLVTFLHELGHALGAIFTGGKVIGMEIHHDGSGQTQTQGGRPGFILIGGYLGSAMLGNLLLYIGVHKKTLTQNTLMLLGFAMAFTGIIWFETFETTGLLFGFALLLFFIALKTDFDQDVLLFLGLATVLYIIQDFNVGPSSDLAQYEQVVGFFPAGVWKFIWLAIVVLLSYWNAKRIFRGLKMSSLR